MDIDDQRLGDDQAEEWGANPPAGLTTPKREVSPAKLSIKVGTSGSSPLNSPKGSPSLPAMHGSRGEM